MSTGWTGQPQNERTLDGQAVGTWTRRLRAACQTLCKTSPGLVQSMVLMQRATDVPWDAGAVQGLTEQFAAEYGLEALVEQSGRCLKIRLSRREHVS
jgi:hypothetical protein